MSNPLCTDEEFIALWKEHKSPSIIAKILNTSDRVILKRRANIENRYDITLESLNNKGKIRGFTIPEDKMRLEIDMPNGTILVGSDCHYNPEYITTAHRGFVEFVKHLKPNIIVMNGDLADFSTISTHHRIGWQQGATVKQELEEVQARLGDIEAVKPAGCKLLATIGNHDLRFSGKLSNVLPQYEGIKGFDLEDHFYHWKFTWSIAVNDNTMIKHRYHNGIHAVYNNIVKSGWSMVTGHLHSLKVTPWTDYSGDRYGVDTGTMACLKDPQFSYAEQNPLNWRSGFAVLTYIDGKLMPPELAQVIDEDKGLIYFRGQLMKV